MDDHEAVTMGVPGAGVERRSRHARVGGVLLGTSEKMAEVRHLISRVADTDVSVLIRGESGTGKELVARAIHSASPRRHRTFVKVNCAALPSELLESELFGFERGAFTGAIQHKPGKFEFAHEGTMSGPAFSALGAWDGAADRRGMAPPHRRPDAALLADAS